MLRLKSARPQALAVLIAIASVARAADPPAALRPYVLPLDNGLRVLIAPDPTVSSVVVFVRYEEGAGDETPAEAGFTHLVEKLMALGTVHTKAGDHDRLVEEAGGWSTSATTVDDLTLTTEVPSNALERVLWLEAERMAGLADGITEAGLADARAAIDAEFRSAYVDQPYALVARAVRETLWPEGHPNRHDVLGDGKTLARATLENVRRFVRSRIQPGSATLVIVGNVDVATTRALVNRLFGWIPGTRLWKERAGEQWPSGGKRELVDVLPKVVVAFVVNDLDTDQTEVIAQLLAGSRDSLLERELIAVPAPQATEVTAEVVRHARGNELRIEVVPVPDADPNAIAETVTRALADVEERIDAAQLERARRAVELQRLQSVETLAGRARAIASTKSTYSTRVTSGSLTSPWYRFALVIARPGTP